MQFRCNTYSSVGQERLKQNIASAHARGLNKPVSKKRPPLAIVGGGPSVSRHIERLKQWKGDIWACGTAYPWAKSQGIKATYFNIDPLPEQAYECDHAILASSCDPTTFDAAKDVECFDLVLSAEYSNHDATVASATPVLAMEMGYTAIVYFGCESSYDGTTHAYDYVNTHEKKFGLWVRVGDSVYPTQPAFLMQAKMLAEILRTCPLVFREASGGLLRALVNHPDFEVIAVNKAMHDELDFEVNGKPVPRHEAASLMPILEMAL